MLITSQINKTKQNANNTSQLNQTKKLLISSQTCKTKMITTSQTIQKKKLNKTC